MDQSPGKKWRGREAQGAVLAVVTLIAFGGAILVSGAQPWGPYVAGALMVVWLVFAGGSAFLQEDRDNKAAGITRRDQTALERTLGALLMVPGMTLLGYSLWLSGQGGSADAVRDYQGGGLFLMFVAHVISAAIQWRLDKAHARRLGAAADESPQ